MNKIIFLDFDGVITHPKSKWKIDPEKLDLIVKIIQATSAKIVVSSSWKRNKTLEELKYKYLRGFNPLFVDSIIGVTPDLSPYRGEEIQYYINAHKVNSYVILDDDSDMLESQLLNFVQTDTYFGISEREVDICIELLNGEYSPNPIRRNLVLTTLWRNKCSGLNDGKLIDKILKNNKYD